MTNPFLCNNFTERARFMIANPNTWEQAMKDAGLTYPGQPVSSSWTVDHTHRTRAMKLARDVVTQSWAWIPINIPEDGYVQRHPIKDDRKACDCKLPSGHESWCHLREAYVADND